jgi:ribose transport system ATP-binding protein
VTRLAVFTIAKSFGETRALAGVSVRAEKGEVHAVLGENGAGKSTLMAILGGATLPDAGSIELDGAPYRPRIPKDARDAGVAVVHQELSLCLHMSVMDNLLLGVEPARLGVVDRKEARARADKAIATVLGETNPRFDAYTVVRSLKSADRQLVEIARAFALAEPCRVLILDEPTSSLAADDAARLFELVRRLAEGGTTVMYVTHFLEELPKVATRYTVLRDGTTVGEGDVLGTPASELVRQMAGRAIEQLFPRSAHTPGEIALSVKDLAGQEKPSRASFVLRRGEVLGIAGLVGAGRTETLRAIFGLDPRAKGEVTAHGTMGLVSEDRKGEGLALRRTLAENVTLSRLPGFVVAPSWEHSATTKWIGELSIKCSGPDARAVELSGGNQQKVALARLLHEGVDIWLLDEPTRGIDVASKAQIYRLIDDLAARGKAILVVSSQLPELLGMCDRISVMRRGVLGEARPASEWTEHALLQEAASSGALAGL